MRTLIYPLVLLLACACAQEQKGDVRASSSTTTTGKPTDMTKPTDTATKPKDVTAMDQSNNEAEVDITKRVRQALVDAENLSVAGKNITVVTKVATVSLRGTVPTTDERARIKGIVAAVSGVREVDDQLEISPK